MLLKNITLHPWQCRVHWNWGCPHPVSAVDQGKFGVGHVTFDPFEAAEAAAAVMVCTRNESDRPTIRTLLYWHLCSSIRGHWRGTCLQGSWRVFVSTTMRSCWQATAQSWKRSTCKQEKRSPPKHFFRQTEYIALCPVKISRSFMIWQDRVKSKH